MRESLSKPVWSSRSTRSTRSSSVWVVATAGASAAMISSSYVAGRLSTPSVARGGQGLPHREGLDPMRPAPRADPDPHRRAAVGSDLVADVLREREHFRHLLAPAQAEALPAERLAVARELDAALAARDERVARAAHDLVGVEARREQRNRRRRRRPRPRHGAAAVGQEVGRIEPGPVEAAAAAHLVDALVAGLDEVVAAAGGDHVVTRAPVHAVVAAAAAQ